MLSQTAQKQQNPKTPKPRIIEFLEFVYVLINIDLHILGFFLCKTICKAYDVVINIILFNTDAISNFIINFILDKKMLSQTAQKQQ